MAYYDSISRGYDELYAEEQIKKLKIIKDKINIGKYDTLLDVGCGSGVSTEFFDWVENKTGVDPSKELIKIAKKKNPQTNYLVGRAEELLFKNGEFDFVLSLTAIQNFEDIEKGLKEIRRVGKASARFALSFLKKSQKKSLLNRK